MSNSTSTGHIAPTNRISGLVDSQPPTVVYSATIVHRNKASSAESCRIARQAKSDRSTGQRLQSLRRVLVLIDLLRVRRFPISTADIVQELNERMAETWHQRTIARDLALLQSSGLVRESERPSISQPLKVWSWLGFDALLIDGGAQQ